MTLVVEILNRAARQCSVIPPSSWPAAIDQTAVEMLDFMDQTKDDIRDRADVVGPLSKTAVITGTDAEDYPLPSDFVRLHRGTYAVYERFRTRRACVPVSDDGEWEYLKELGSAGAYRFYRLQGYPGAWTIGFQMPLDSGLTVVANYVSDNWLVNNGTPKASFTDAADISMLPRELMEMGIIYRFRQRKGLEYGDVQSRYEILMARYLTDSRTRRQINFGRVPSRSPWDIPVPDILPSL